ncbi:MAG: hypothetical protein AB1473_10485 [Thermodesulfobacteriota bacterium]
MMDIGCRFGILVMRFLCLTLLACWLLTVTSHSEDKYPKKYLLLSGEVNVTAVYTLQGGEPQEGPDGGARYIGRVTIHVAREDKSYDVTYDPLSSDPPDKAIEEIRKGVGWKEGYLFVPSSCGTGNAWKCHTDVAFAVKQGNLVKLGYFSGGLHPWRPGPGGSYVNGYFYDVFDWLEVNPLTGHATAPPFFKVMKEDDGLVFADLDRTWGYNVEYYKKACDDIDDYIKTYGGNVHEWASIVSSLLLCAALAKYCDRQPEPDLAMRQAKDLLPEKEFRVFEDLIERRVVKGNTPVKH